MGIAILELILGALALLSGRRIFWLAMGTAGFLLGLFYMINFYQGATWLKVLIGLVVGLFFAVLARALPKLMIAIVGFAAFGIAAVSIGLQFGLLRGTPVYWLVFGLAGLFGASLVFWLFDWALILGTSLIGASAILTGLADLVRFTDYGLLWMIFFLFLLAIGVSVQSNQLKKAD